MGSRKTNVLWFAIVLSVVLCDIASAEVGVVSFNRNVRPILAENCFQCHGPDAASREADLRLDTSRGALAGREDAAAIVPGDPSASTLIERIISDEEGYRMPPEEFGKQLTSAQIEILRRWIAGGAGYEDHWSFQPIQRGVPPTVEDPSWVRTPIDSFVLAELEQKGVSPSSPADRFTLVRRVYLDFLGILPSIGEADAFVQDARPDAYARLLDRVLANPHFGERWGRHWLDQARYADSHGYTNDNARTIWPYRDWVIEALNRDLPFDRFTHEQLAGDLLPDPALPQLVATGFHRNTLINSEGGTKADQFRDEQVKDRVDTTGGVWLGLTIGCAKCHSHKFDPITQEEYYRIYAFFNSTADNNSIAPTIKAPTLQQELRSGQLAERRAELQRRLAADAGREERFAAWQSRLLELVSSGTNEPGDDPADSMWTVLELDAKSVEGASLTSLEDRSVLASGANAPSDEYQLTARTPLTTVRSVRLEALTHESLPQQGPGRAVNGNFVLSETWFRTGDGRELRFSKAFADHSQPKYPVAGAIDGNPNTGWAINRAPEGGLNHDRTAWFVLPVPLEVEEGHALTFSLQFNNNMAAYNLGRLRLSISAERWTDTLSREELAKIARIPASDRAEAQQRRLDEAFLKVDPLLSPVFEQLQAVLQAQEELASRIPTTMVLRELDRPRQTHQQIRGDFLRPGTPVEAGVPAALPPLGPTDRAPSRLDLARWLTRPDHPLTPRVRVNRIWMRLFGLSLVETENDFGTQGAAPTNARLLDWLASEFVRGGWSTKRFLRLIANSAVYRQSSQIRPEMAARDPRNLLLARQNRVRVEGEIVRDLALSASGLLSRRIGGPSVFPPQPEGVYAFTQRKKEWKVSSGEDRFRRGMYTFFYRSAPYPMLTTFDAPKFNQTCTRRDRSNTPLQALTVANDEAMVELTSWLARRVLGEENSDLDARLRMLFRLCVVRPPSPAEQDVLGRFWRQQLADFSRDAEAAETVASRVLRSPVPPAEAAAWVATARVVLNLDEFITRE